MNSVSLHEYHRPIHGISREVDFVIQGKVPDSDLASCEKARHFEIEAKLHKAILNLPSTNRALDKVLHGHRLRRLVGLVSLPTAMVHDIFSVPYHLARRKIASSRLSIKRKKVENDVLDEIMDSLCTSLEIIFKMLIRLGLKTPESLKRQIQDIRYLRLLTLARLLEAYRSRLAPAGTVYLVSQKRLPREHCSGIARLHFDQIHYLKEDFISIGLRSTENPRHTSAAIATWLPRVWQALNRSSVEDENELFCNLLKRMRNTHDTLSELILPVSKS